jgi:hypothetical protein
MYAFEFLGKFFKNYKFECRDSMPLKDNLLQLLELDQGAGHWADQGARAKDAGPKAMGEGLPGGQGHPPAGQVLERPSHGYCACTVPMVNGL